MAGKSGFFAELKRRHVWRVAIAYAVTAWMALQLASIVFPTFGAPDWVLKAVIVLLVIGFPIALVLAWAFELTPEGIRYTEPADSPTARSTHAAHAVARQLNGVIIAVLVAAVALLGWRVLALSHVPTGRVAATVAAPLPRAIAADRPHATIRTRASPRPASIAAKSIAVLPFVNESGDLADQSFSDGLSEDLITALSQFQGIKVISRHSAFQFRDSDEPIAAIGRKLGVAHVLEGSVRRVGATVRINVTLVNTADGSTSWSQRYDRAYLDLFALQDAITRDVATALETRLQITPGAVEQSDRPPSGNLAAFAAYQRGITHAATNTEASTHQAIAAFAEATRLDPNYAAAYAQAALEWTDLAGRFLAGRDKAQASTRAHAAAATALQLDANSALAHQARAELLLIVDMDWTGAQAEYQRALHLAPHDAAVKFGLGRMLAIRGQVRPAVEATRRALQTDPRHATWYRWLAVYLTGLGKLDAAQHAIDTAIALQPDAVSSHVHQVIIDVLRGDAKSALAAARHEPRGVWRAIAVAFAVQIGPSRATADAALQELITRHGDQAPFQVAEVYALRGEPDAMFHWLDRAWVARDGGMSLLLLDPFILRYRHDPRFTAFCRKVGLPTTTDAVAMQPPPPPALSARAKRALPFAPTATPATRKTASRRL